MSPQPAQSIDHLILGRAVREIRARFVLSQERVGLTAGLHRNYVGAIERGEINPTFQSPPQASRPASPFRCRSGVRLYEGAAGGGWLTRPRDSPAARPWSGTGDRRPNWNKSCTREHFMCRICSMPAPHSNLDLLRDRFDSRPFSVSEAVAAGVSRTTLHRLREAGELASVSRGLVQLPDGGMGMLSELAAVSARVPRGTICLNSALAFWDLTDEIPEQVHLAVPRGTHRPSIDRPVTRVHVFVRRNLRDRAPAGADRRRRAVLVYSPERSVVDAMRMTRWIGRDVARHALRRYMAGPRADPARLAELARELGGGAQLRPALETLLSCPAPRRPSRRPRPRSGPCRRRPAPCTAATRSRCWSSTQVESFLRRLAISDYADQMVLKGGMLMAANSIRRA